MLCESHEKIRTAARHLLSLIDDTLQASKLGEGKLELVCEPVDLARLQADVADIMQLPAANAGVSMEGHQNKGSIAHRYVLGSELYLRQIFLNIYSNCVKYNRRGGKVITHVVSSKQPDGKILVRWEIADTGIGMSQEFLKHVFEPFSREENAGNGVGGTGLGMPIVKQLVELMGGSIKVSSKLNVGSTFVISIPFEPAVQPQEAEQAASEPTIEGCRLLLVEDNDLNAEIAIAMLSEVGLVIDRAENGVDCAEKLDKAPAGYYSLILMDIQMPVQDGYATTEMIHRYL